ncbi:hypothetical protein BJX99DRAFT_122752 [Aspergillus californicus]
MLRECFFVTSLYLAECVPYASREARGAGPCSAPLDENIIHHHHHHHQLGLLRYRFDWICILRAMLPWRGTDELEMLARSMINANTIWRKNT